MLEALRHIIGICGEPHPSLITLILGTPIVSFVIYKINMFEALRHIIGICGEPHPSLITLILGTPIVSFVIYKIKKNK